MKVALIGYGKMGQHIASILEEKGHTISNIIDVHNHNDIHNISPQNADVCIEFTTPKSAISNLKCLINNKNNIVCGTTGWYEQKNEIINLALLNQIGLICATNFSIGVNLYFNFLEYMTARMSYHTDYKVHITETHHVNKLDQPSGTATSMAEITLNNYPELKGISLNGKDPKNLSIYSYRKDEVPGTHTISFESDIDSIEFKHTAHNRMGFAHGAVLAAEYLVDKKGVFTMKDVLSLTN